jgi:class 3 adenylate cyclase
MFTDIEGFTTLLRSLDEEEAHELVHVHSWTVRECVQRKGGFEVKALGDGFMAVFTTACQAVRCAVDIQRAYPSTTASTHSGRSVRMGISTACLPPWRGLLRAGGSMAARVVASPGQMVTDTSIHRPLGVEFAERVAFR